MFEQILIKVNLRVVIFMIIHLTYVFYMKES